MAKEEKKVIESIDADFGREDLNAVKDKLNEVIEAVNAL